MSDRSLAQWQNTVNEIVPEPWHVELEVVGRGVGFVLRWGDGNGRISGLGISPQEAAWFAICSVARKEERLAALRQDKREIDHLLTSPFADLNDLDRA